jgi:hypothetical protein
MTQLNPDDTLSHAQTMWRPVTRAPRVQLQGEGQTNIVPKAGGLGAVAR